MSKKNVVITGANGGIGFELTKKFLADGCIVVALDKDLDKLLTLSSDNRLYMYEVELAQYAVLSKIFSDLLCSVIKEGVDVLILACGVFEQGTSTLSLKEISGLIESNITASLNILNIVIDSMKRNRKGHIINFASKSALSPTATYGGYALTKAGIHAYLKSLYKEMIEFNVKVTSICPGVVNTPMTQNMSIDDVKKIQITDVLNIVEMLLSLSHQASIKEIEIDCTDMINKPIF